MTGNSKEGSAARRGSEELAATAKEARAARSAWAGVASPFPRLVKLHLLALGVG